MNGIKRPALRYHGSKFRIAPWIISHMPYHCCYVEPFGGGAGVLLRKPRSHGEVYNDLDGDIINFFRVLRCPEKNQRLRELCALTPYHRDEFDLAYEHTDEPIERARRTVIRAAMGFGSASATGGKTGFRTDTKHRYSTAQDLWARYPDHLAAVGKRLMGILIENRPAIEIMHQHDTQETLHYVDPPYLPAVRNRWRKSGYAYRHEMTEQDHITLIESLKTLQGGVILSGYDSELYNDVLPGWRKEVKNSQISGNRGTSRRTECLWINSQIEAMQCLTEKKPRQESAGSEIDRKAPVSAP